MIKKHPLCPQRIRKTPGQFSWVDHRLVRDHHIESCSHPAAALYLFLVTVADYQGLSYYSDRSIMKRLGMDPITLEQARENLITIGLIAHDRPLYQVLSLEPEANAGTRHSMDRPLSIGELFKQITGETL